MRWVASLSDSLVREAAAVDISHLEKRKKPGRIQPPGLSRFSTLFYVAAIGGKSPRHFDCGLMIVVSLVPVKREAGAIRRG
jgi:hypothetical protein